MDRLTMDSIAAQKAGMTYGKWKALHPYTSGDYVLTENVRICEICGKPIAKRSGTGKGRKKYCSIECAAEANVIKNREFYRRRKERLMENGKI